MFVFSSGNEGNEWNVTKLDLGFTHSTIETVVDLCFDTLTNSNVDPPPHLLSRATQ